MQNLNPIHTWLTSLSVGQLVAHAQAAGTQVGVPIVPMVPAAIAAPQVPQPVPIIPKPKGTYGGGKTGYNLQRAMGLAHDRVRYNQMKVSSHVHHSRSAVSTYSSSCNLLV